MKKLFLLGALLAVSTGLIRAQADPRQVALDAASSTASSLARHLGPGHTLVPSGVFVDSLGQGHVRYQQVYRGVPVFEGEAIVHVDMTSRGVLDTTDATLAFGPIPVATRLTAVDAHRRAMEYVGLAQVNASQRTLLVMVDAGVASVVWQVRAEGEDSRGPFHKVAFVDANGRGVLRAWDNLETATASGTGRSYFSGTVALSTDVISGGYSLKDATRGSQSTVNMGTKTSGNGTLMTDADNAWGDGTTSNTQTVGVDAQYGAAVTWDYFKTVHGRNGIGNDSKGATSRVHYSRSYNNAFWQESCFCMTYGDGDGVNYNPFVSLDVAGHEMTHGITNRTAKLTYSGESGGLNESTSDIFGSMVEYYANNVNETPDYLIGERIFKGSGRFFRSMSKPSLDGASADCYYSTVGQLGVHNSSGVSNHFFYLLAEGTTSGAPSPTCKTGDTRVASGTGSLTGIGRAKAEKIWYRALTTYMTSSTTFAGARTATISAAKDLYGSTSVEATAVAAAWTAVGRN